MKSLDIALKDLTSSFRSAFAVIFMFAIPILVTGLFYFMFGNIGGGGGFSVPVTKVIIANLDQGSLSLQQADIPELAGTQVTSLGELVVSVLQRPEFSDLLQVSSAADAESARTAVDNQSAGAALILPADFSDQFNQLDGQAVLEMYADPTLRLGPAIVQSVLQQFLDSFSGAKIAVQIVANTAGANTSSLVGGVINQYLAGMPQGNPATTYLDVRSPVAAQAADNLLLNILTPIMGGMMIFYAFYTGTATAQTILREEEQRTLPRLFTTPTPQATILSGKFLAVFLTVLMQIVVLIIFARLVFGIQWGDAGRVTLMAAGTILAASTFGIFVNSLLKSTKQGGVVFGGALTFSGMLGMIPIFASSSENGSGLVETISLFVPQGWAVRAMFQSMSNAPLAEVALTSLILLAWSAVFFALGTWRFQKRYA